MKRMKVVACVVVAFLALGAPLEALEEIDPGVYRIDLEAVDELLDLPNRANVRLLILEDSQPKSVSDAHSKQVQSWVESGGVLWVASDGLESAIVSLMVPFRVERFKYTKSSTDKRGGELVLRGASSRLVIHDHPLTAGVDRLYLFPRFRFDGTRNAQPLVSMTDTRGNSGLLIAAVSVGDGLLVLDGTARERRRLFRRMPGFNAKYPNSVKQGQEWNSYDWERLMSNALARAGSD